MEVRSRQRSDKWTCISEELGLEIQIERIMCLKLAFEKVSQGEIS